MRKILTFAVILCLCSFAFADSIIPDTPAGNFLNEFIKAFNSGDEQVWTDFIRQDKKAVDSIEVFNRRLELFRMIFNDLGRMELHSITEQTDYNISAIIKATSENPQFEWVRFMIELDSLPPHDWAGVGLRPADNPDEKLPEGELTDELIIKYTENLLNDLAAKDRFSGAVLVARDGQPIFMRAYGLASRRYNVLNKIDTKFNLGSMNKMFTGVAIAQLVEQGRLSFDDPIIKYLPDYPNKEDAERITIHHLLTHTSGMGSYWNELFESYWPEIRTVEQVYDLFKDKPLEFEPGERFGYSNSGPIVLGMIIEKVTGMSYYDYIREHIYKPAGMINTDCYEMDLPVPNLAIGYTIMDYTGQRGDTLRNNLFLHTVKGGPAGGGYSTVEDLLKFDIALRNHKLLSKEYTDIVTAGKIETDPDIMYAYLFGDEKVNGHRIVGHGGGAPGINAKLDMYWDLGYTVAVMSNIDNGAVPVANKLQKLLTK